MWAHLIDRSMYYVGRKVAHKDGIRKWRDRPAVAQGEAGEIVQVAYADSQYGLTARCLVKFANGERWTPGSSLELFGESLEISTPESRAAQS